MDSLTQIILGAAVGEACLGKKIGNRAILWGGVAGTIPDLDIIGNFFMSKIDALAFHRGISHSIFFSVFGAIVFGWLLYKLYNNSTKIKNPKLQSWQWMLFLAFFTHIILDCFTSYGTQLFAPFSYYRVAIGSISIADPVYTLPFLTCLIVSAFYNRKNIKRRYWNYTGIGLSSLYLLFTVYNKSQITSLFEDNLNRLGIEYSDISLSPTILNNQLWYGIAKTDTGYVQGHYSMLDSIEEFKLTSMNGNHDWINPKDDDHTINTLKWFSNGFYNVIRQEDGDLQINDLRFGTFNTSGKKEDRYIFRFEIEKLDNGYYNLVDSDGGPKKGNEKEVFSTLYERWKGI